MQRLGRVVSHLCGVDWKIPVNAEVGKSSQSVMWRGLEDTG